ncbi:MAG: hypothetical protein HQK50_01520 [Oligoflexia bacterium]|nr:hypothetical protein [Oligoflexia bacterium]MBF0364216.1 hypothetical protein [Oligoflexia bacterium]
MKKNLMFTAFIFMATLALANAKSTIVSIEQSEKLFTEADRAPASAVGAGSGSGGGHARFAKIINSLIEENVFYGAAAFIADIPPSVRTQEMEVNLNLLYYKVGARYLERVLGDRLAEAKWSVAKYIYARKLYLENKGESALNILGSISADYSIFASAQLIEASVLGQMGRNEESIEKYLRCYKSADSYLGSLSGKEQFDDERKTLEIVRDECILGIARTYYAAGDYYNAHLTYLDIQKDSYLWPQVPVEEAWNSYALKDYNRTLGKLATYKAPFFSMVFNPEIEVLRTLTYMEMCLWGDAKETVDHFYSYYSDDMLKLLKEVRSHAGDEKYFLQLMKSNENAAHELGGNLQEELLSMIAQSHAYKDMHKSVIEAREEIERIKELKGKDSIKAAISKNIDAFIVRQLGTMGGLIEDLMMRKLVELEAAFKSLSYIKLEILGKEKGQLYTAANQGERARGDIAFLQRNDKQYFWTFNGEFWADELGDYVFALGSECR